MNEDKLYDFIHLLGDALPKNFNTVMAVNYLGQLTDGERKLIFSIYCTECGSEDPGCQCWNDE